MCRVSDRFTMNPDVMWKQLGSQIVTLHVKTHQYHVLNEAAAFIYERANGQDTVDTVAHELSERFTISAEQALEDTQETVDGMVKLGLISCDDTSVEGYDRPAVRPIAEEEFKGAIASGAELACRSLLGA